MHFVQIHSPLIHLAQHVISLTCLIINGQQTYGHSSTLDLYSPSNKFNDQFVSLYLSPNHLKLQDYNFFIPGATMGDKTSNFISPTI